MKIAIRLSLAAAVAAGAIFASVGSASANLVTNGSFDADSPPDGTAPAGWTFVPASTGSDFFVGVGPTYGAFSPPNSANFGSVGALDDELSQTLTTVMGDTYQISFELAHDENDDENDFSVFFGSDELFSLTDAAVFGYTDEIFTSTATSDSTELAFFGREVPAWYDLDNVDVEDLGAAGAPVPEPTSLALFGTALAGMWLRRRNKA